MKHVDLHISPLHATTVAAHLLIVLKNYITGKPSGSIAEEKMAVLKQIDHIYQKLAALNTDGDDETPQAVALTLSEAEAFISVFTEEEYQQAASADSFYQQHSYAAYFAQIYARYMEAVSEEYVRVLAA